MVEAYLEKKKLSWSESTIEAAGTLLRAHRGAIEDGDPASLFGTARASGLSSYTIQTYFIWAAGYYAFLNPGKVNVFTEFRKENRRVFKNCYQKKEVKLTYNEVKALLEKAKDCKEKEIAKRILSSAQRASEAGARRGAGRLDGPNPGSSRNFYLIGKGGKQRINFAEGADLSCDYYRFYRWVKKHLGVTPHALRKLALTRAAEKGAGAADLCAIAGWSSIATAYVYLQPKEADRLKGFLE